VYTVKSKNIPSYAYENAMRNNPVDPVIPVEPVDPVEPVGAQPNAEEICFFLLAEKTLQLFFFRIKKSPIGDKSALC
jgi:hypothetical protein